MFKAYEVYRWHELKAFISDGENTIIVDLRIKENIFHPIQSGGFDVDKAVFQHPNGTMCRTFANNSNTSNRATLETLISGPMSWFNHMIDLPQSYQAFVEWIEDFPDKA
jgi:hypothetical protein